MPLCNTSDRANNNNSCSHVFDYRMSKCSSVDVRFLCRGDVETSSCGAKSHLCQRTITFYQQPRHRVVIKVEQHEASLHEKVCAISQGWAVNQRPPVLGVAESLRREACTRRASSSSPRRRQQSQQPVNSYFRHTPRTGMLSVQKWYCRCFSTINARSFFGYLVQVSFTRGSTIV